MVHAQYLGNAIRVSTGLNHIAITVKSPGGAPSVGEDEERANGVGAGGVDGGVSGAVMGIGLSQ